MKNKKTKKIPLWKTLTVFSLLLGVFVAVGYATFVVDDPVVNTSDSTATSGETEDKEKVKVDFRYQICDGMIVTTYQEEALGDVNGTTYELGTEYAIDNSSSYNAFQDLMETLTGNRPGDLPSGNHQYPGIGDWSNDYIILSVTAEIKFTDGGTCGSDSYEGKYKISKQQKEESTYRYSYDTDIKFSTDLDSGDTLSDLRSLIMDHLNEVSAGYTFVGFKETVFDAEGNPSPSDVLLSEDTTIDEDSSYYLVLNSDNDLSDYKNNLSDTISKLQSGEKTFNAQVATGDENVTNDLSYFEGDKAVFLTHETTIHEGVTINFGLNDGAITKTASGNYHNFEPENDNHELQYKVVLQNDMVIDGKLVVGSNYGVNVSNQSQGLITNEYVCLDLNGHDIMVGPTGSLESYGLIKDSKGTGRIVVKGGAIKTLVAIQDYHGGGATLSMKNAMEFPFWIYSMPYLRCHVRLCQDESYNWGRFYAQCHFCVATTGGATYSSPVLNFIGPRESSESNFLFALSKSDNTEAIVDIEGYRMEALEAELSATEQQKCLAWRMKISLHQVDCTMQSIVMTLSMKVGGFLPVDIEIDTRLFIFPIASFFDIVLFSSNLTVAQKIRFMPGASFISDENSTIFLTNDGKRSAQISVLSRGYYYYDSKLGKVITNDNHQYEGEVNDVKTPTNVSSTYTILSTAFWKYFTGSRVKIYGVLAFQEGNASVEEYLLAGNIDFNRIAYYSDPNDLHFIDEGEENPFSAVVGQASSCSIKTFDFGTLMAMEEYHSGGYALPLVSHGTWYYQNGTDVNASLTGTFDSETGILMSGEQTYYFDCSGSFTLRDDASCTLKTATYDETNHVFIDSSSNEQFIYFGGMYCRFNSTDQTADVSRVTKGSTVEDAPVVFDESLNRWVRA